MKLKIKKIHYFVQKNYKKLLLFFILPIFCFVLIFIAWKLLNIPPKFWKTSNKSNYLYVAKNKLFTVNLGNKKTTEPEFIFSKGISQIGFNLINVNPQIKISKNYNSVLFENVYQGINLKYKTTIEGLKEEIIIEKIKDINTFNFDMSLKNIDSKSIQINEKVKEIIFQNNYGEEIMKIDKPFAIDTSGSRTDDVYYYITETGKETYNFELVVDKKWLSSPERVYPVIIDPSITTIESNYLHDKIKTADTTPELRFSATDAENDSLTYQITYDTDSSFPSPISKTSDTDAGFSNITTPLDTDPFNSGNIISYTFQSALTNNTTYYYKVRAKDPLGSDTYGSYSSTKSITIDTSLNQNAWNETHADQFSTDTLSNAYVNDTENNVYTVAASQTIDNADDLENWTSSDTSYTKIDQETSIKYEGTGSVRTKISGFTGDGADGTITVSSNTDINTTNLISGRSCADGGDAVNYSVSALSSNTATLTSTPSSGCLAAGDEVLIINLQGTSSAYGNVGNYEILEIQNINGNTITFRSNKANYYGSGSSDDNGIGTTTSDQRVMFQRVPNYTNVTVNSSQNFYPSAWNGTKGGVMAFRANGIVTITGTIHANSRGYVRGDNTGSKIGGDGGDSFCSIDGGGDGGDSCSGCNANGINGLCGGGGGAALYRYSGLTGAGSPGSGTASLGGAGGGGGSGSNELLNSYCDAWGAGGGGGGYGSGAGGGVGYSTAGEGGNGGTNSSGNGGSYGGDSYDSYGGGGGGGGTYGDASLTDLFFGSAGAAGGDGEFENTGYYDGGDGGNGGGIIYISANEISVSGGIQSNGQAGSGGQNATYSGAGGGGAGGSIKLLGHTINVGSGLVTAAYGSKGTTGQDGGDGGVGRIRVEYITSSSGTTNPGASTSTTPLSINDTVTTTKSAIDLTLYNNIKFWVRSERSGQFMRFQFGESDSSEQTYDITISSVNTWEQKNWDISGIPSASRDAITKFAFKVIDTSTGTFFYFDDIQNINFGDGVGTITSTAITATNIDPADSTWGTLVWNDTETNGDIKYSVYYDDTGTPTIIPDGVLSGNSTGFDEYPVNLVNISTTTYPILYLKATLNYSNGSPTLDDWTLLFDNVPTIPSLDLPTNSQTSIPVRTVFKTTTTDSNSDYLQYKITVCTNSDMTSNCQTFDQTSSQTGWSGQNANGGLAYSSGAQAIYTVQSVFLPNTVYYWKTYAKDPIGSNTWSLTQDTPYSFKTSEIPNTPSLDLPIDTAVNQSIYPVLKTTTTDNDSDYVQYKIQLCKDGNMTLSCSTFDQTSSQTGWSGQNANGGLAYASGTQAIYTIQSILDFNTTYYWKSYAKDPVGSENWSLTQVTPYSFTTGEQPTQPTNLQTEGTSNPTGVIDTTPEFSAICHHSVEGASLTKYQIQVDDDVNFASPIWDSGDSGTAMTSCTAGSRSSEISYGGSALSTNGSLYYWKIRFWDEWTLVSPWSTEQALFVMDQENAADRPSSCRIKEATDESSLTLLWNDNSSSESQYRIERNVDAVGFSLLINKAADSTSHTDSTVAANHTYQYRVRAEGTTNSEWCTTTTVDLSLGNFNFDGVNLKGIILR